MYDYVREYPGFRKYTVNYWGVMGHQVGNLLSNSLRKNSFCVVLTTFSKFEILSRNVASFHAGYLQNNILCILVYFTNAEYNKLFLKI